MHDEASSIQCLITYKVPLSYSSSYSYISFPYYPLFILTIQSMISKSLPIPKALKTMAKGISFVTVLILQWIRGAPLSFFTISLKTAGKAAIPFGTERIYVIQGVDYSLVLKV